MKKILGLAAIALALAGGLAAAVAQYNSANYMAQNGADWTVGGTLTVASGGVETVASGGAINVATGGALKFNAVDKTTALAAAVTTPVAGIAASYKVARGETALGGTNPTAVATGLASITGCALSIKLNSAPGVGTSVVTYDTATGTMNMYGWKVTNSSTTTLIASTGTETIGWVCVGT